MSLNEIRDRAHATAKAKGWYDGDAGQPSVPEKIALIHSELSEALECYRDGEMVVANEHGKPTGFPTEIADAIIRLADLAGYLVIDLDRAVEEKMAFNDTRPHRHGGKRC